MKFLYVTTVSDTINAFLLPHIAMLVESGYSVDIATNITQPIDEKVHQLGCKIYQIDFQRNPLSLKNIMSFKQLSDLMKDQDYDVLHTHTPIASMIARLSAIKIRKNGLKVFYTAHGFHFYRGAPSINWLVYYPIEKILSRFTDVIITINKEDYNLARKKFRGPKIFLTSGVGVDRQKFKPIHPDDKHKIRKKMNIKKDEYLMISVGELNKNKNHIVLIEAVKKICNEFPNIKLIIVGTGRFKNKYQRLIEDNNLQDNIILLGYREDVDILMCISDLAISSSYREGLPVNVIEAMSVGLPLIVSSCRGNVDLVKNNYNGFIFDPKSSAQLEINIKKMITNRELSLKFRDKNIIISEKYDVEKSLGSLKEIYKNIL